MKFKCTLGSNVFEVDGDLNANAMLAFKLWLAAQSSDAAALQAIASKIESGADAVDVAGKKLDTLGKI